MITLSTPDRAALLEAIPFLHVRDQAIIMLMLIGGLRGIEVRHLKPAQVVLVDDYPKLTLTRTKGNKKRNIPIADELALVLAAWQAARDSGAEYFIHQLQGPVLMPIAHDSLERAVAKACDAAGIERVNPHALRHTAATNWLRMGLTIYEVSTLLGHADLATTAVYLHADNAEIARKLGAVS